MAVERPIRHSFRPCALALAIAGSLLAPATLGANEAFTLLDQTVDAYQRLGSYRDHGELVIATPTDQGMVEETYRFSTAATGDGGFLFRLSGAPDGSPERVVWRRDGGIWISQNAHVRPVQSVASAFDLLFGDDVSTALTVPAILSGSVKRLEEVGAAALDGTDSCGNTTCDIVLLSLNQGLTLARLWIDRASSLVRRVEVDRLPPARRGDDPATVQRTTRVMHRIDSLDQPLAAELLSFQPPTTPRSESQSPAPSVEPQESDRRLVITDQISVELRTLAVRALDLAGRPIRGLGPADFEITLGRRQIPVVAADWVPASGREPVKLESMSMTPPAPLTPRNQIDGQLIVLFIQADFNAVRIKGHLRVLPFVREFLAALEPQDWVAVVSFDSHLKLWHDFSRDRQTVGDAVERAVRFGGMPPLLTARGRSLVQTFPTDEARQAATPETALRLTARSLLDIDGEKTIVYLGWGLGRYGSFGFHMRPEYDRTLATLDAARATVFVLDVTDAAYHTLELGIRKVAQDTGGTYAKTNIFARREVLRLTETLSGYYLLTLDRDTLPEEHQRLRISLRNHRGEVLLRQRHLAR